MDLTHAKFYSLLVAVLVNLTSISSFLFSNSISQSTGDRLSRPANYRPLGDALRDSHSPSRHQQRRIPAPGGGGGGGGAGAGGYSQEEINVLRYRKGYYSL